MTNLFQLLQSGFGLENFASFLGQSALGTFFVFSGYHKLFNPTRHASLVATLKACGVPFLGFNQWFVPSVEFLGGAALVLNILPILAASGLLAICSVAICTDGLKRVRAFQPIDPADYLDDFLYLPETLMAIGLTIIILA